MSVCTRLVHGFGQFWQLNRDKNLQCPQEIIHRFYLLLPHPRPKHQYQQLNTLFWPAHSLKLDHCPQAQPHKRHILRYLEGVVVVPRTCRCPKLAFELGLTNFYSYDTLK